MKHFRILAAVAALLLVSVSCNKDGNDNNDSNNPLKPLELSTKSAEFAKIGNTFAYDFIARINASETEDYVVSPLSMQFLLGMILNGAKGETAEEICNVLGYGEGETEAVNEYCLSMMEQLPSMDKKTKLSIANAIFVNKIFPLQDAYKTNVGKYYMAEVSNLDFNDESGSLKKMNGWCSEKTNGLVPKVLNNVDPDMLAYLFNAIYFKSQWMLKFEKSITAKETFTTEGGSEGKVDMMKKMASTMYQDDDNVQVVRLNYGNGAYYMLVVLPQKGKTVADAVSYMNTPAWDKFLKTLVTCQVDLWLPRFETKYSKKLNDILSDMGMPSSFDQFKADFTDMSKFALCLSFVKQDAIIKVDEEGTEAAVVSSAGMNSYTSAGPGQQVVFHADHPFLYLIMEQSTGAVLFAGKYSGK